MTKQEKIDKIYEVIADKTLSFGCRVHTEHGEKLVQEDIYWVGGDKQSLYCEGPHGCIASQIEAIIGHPVMIGDVLDWIERVGKQEYRYKVETIFKWKEKRKSIKEQDEDCIDFIYRLLPNE